MAGADPRLAQYRGARVLVTGVLGFIGSNLARRLLALGAQVSGLDSCRAETGANPYNLDGIRAAIRFAPIDQRDGPALQALVADQQVIFNLVGQVSHINSMQDPLTDLELNARAQLVLLEACRAANPHARILYASTRQVYGRPDYVPVDEHHPLRPMDVNGINKAAGEQYHLLYHRVHGLRTSVLRLTNTYGPRMLVKNNRQTFLGWFIRQVLDGETIQLFGDGGQLRDFTYVDDLLQAFLLAGLSDAVVGNVFNVGGVAPRSLLDVTRLLVELAGQGGYRLVPFPDEKKAIDVGSVYADDSRLRRVLGWAPYIELEAGLAATLDFYRQERAHYWPAVFAPDVDVPFNDLRPGTQAMRGELEAAAAEVLDSGRYLLGAQGEAFEREFAAWIGRSFGVGVASGTDAIRLALLALGVGPGDDVITVANAGILPVVAVLQAGARPVFVDVDADTATLDPTLVEAHLTPRTRAILVVHLYGHPANLAPLVELARAHGLALVEDCAQAHGARYRGRAAGTFGDAAAFSFYPTKNLGALGDAGMVLVDDARIADRLRLLRNYGWRTQYASELRAGSSRLDELQAALLRAKLRHLDQWNVARRERATWYAALLAGAPLALPSEQPWAHHAFHLYVVRAAGRDALRRSLADRGIGTAIHYPQPAHLQEPFRELGRGAGSLPVTEAQAAEILSLPMFPELGREQLAYVAATVRELIAAPR